MNLRYKLIRCTFLYINRYELNCSNIAFYRYWDNGLTARYYKDKSMSLIFLELFEEVINHPSGIKIYYFQNSSKCKSSCEELRFTIELWNWGIVKFAIIAIT